MSFYEQSRINIAMQSTYKRVNVMILEDQYQALNERGLNVSGLIRDLLGDHLSDNAITLQVSEDTRRIYDLVVSNTGSTDEDIEGHLRVALANVLEQRIGEMQQIHKQLVKESKRKRS